jgi:hypothetical protein
MQGIYDMMDQASADVVGIPVEEYIDRIEWLLDKNFNRGETLMNALWDESEEVQKKASRLFLEATANYQCS